MLAETKKRIESNIGITIDELYKMDIDDEVKYVEEKTGRKLAYPSESDSRRVARGNPLIGECRFLTTEDVDKRYSRFVKKFRKK